MAGVILHPVRPVLAATLLAVSAGCRPAPAPDGEGVQLHGAYGHLPVTQDQAAVYFALTNPGTTADTLLSLACDEADRAMIHQSVADGSMVRMEHLDLLEVPAGGTVRLAPGGLHVMLIGLDAMPAAGDSLHLALEFARSGTIRTAVFLIPYGDPSPQPESP